MSDYKPEMKQLEDDHLDAMLRLAFDYKEDVELQELIEKSKRELTPEEEAQAEAVYQLFEKKYEKEIAKEKSTRRHQRSQRFVGGFARVAACILLVLVLATPFAVANIGPVRERVLKILMSFEDGHIDVEIGGGAKEDDGIPEGWRGEYYPSYIPVGFEYSCLSEDGKSVEFLGVNNELIIFHEYGEGDLPSFNSAESNVYYIPIAEAEAMVIENTDWCIIIWEKGDVMMAVTAQSSVEEAQKIAESIKPTR